MKSAWPAWGLDISYPVTHAILSLRDSIGRISNSGSTKTWATHPRSSRLSWMSKDGPPFFKAVTEVGDARGARFPFRSNDPKERGVGEFAKSSSITASAQIQSQPCLLTDFSTDNATRDSVSGAAGVIFRIASLKVGSLQRLSGSFSVDLFAIPENLPLRPKGFKFYSWF